MLVNYGSFVMKAREFKGEQYWNVSFSIILDQ